DAMGPIVFVVVVFGGLGSLTGCFVASLIMGLIQSYAVVVDYSLSDLTNALFGASFSSDWFFGEFMNLHMNRIGPVLPYVLMVLMLAVRPRGLMGTRDT
ncbi:MAG TPA: hypothetical protein VE175_11010, partial [Woeseiaceae bacterium]|nr:hypothetical protein [Woeseiaceae bacterium]